MKPMKMFYWVYKVINKSIQVLVHVSFINVLFKIGNYKSQNMNSMQSDYEHWT